MPGLNGWNTLEKLVKTRANRPVIIITAHRDNDLNKKVFEAGAVGFLQKPFEDHYLLHMVHQAFNKTI